MDYSKRIEDLEERLRAIEKLVADNQGRINSKPLSLREMLNSYAPKTANDKAVLIGYYYETVKGQSAFSLDDIRGGFLESKTPLPKNLSDVFAKNIKRGFIMPSTTDYRTKTWVLTNSGEKFIKELISNND